MIKKHDPYAALRFREFNIFLLIRFLLVLGWSMQFIGHWIEGYRPALTDSISQAFVSAPLFSMQYFFPNLLK